MAVPYVPGRSNEPLTTQKSIKAERLEALLGKSTVDINELKDALWSGVPKEAHPSVRSLAWRIMLGYVPVAKARREAAVERKHQEYSDLVQEYYTKDSHADTEMRILRQIRVDLPRTLPGSTLFAQPRIHQMMERILFLWAVRHPASGYVQGINDLITPFILVFLRARLEDVEDMEDVNISTVSLEALQEVEADAYFCLCNILANIQDHYTFGQPGIQRLITRLREIVKRVDERLYTHLEDNGLDFLQFSFRWMNCFLMREFPIRCVIRLWDTYIAEQGEGFSTFHTYVCAVFLVYWSNQLKTMDFQQMMLFMQNFPTQEWGTQEIETLLAEAFVLKSLFHASPSHLM
eukprot:GHVT01064506.1.p1 GENE.GHVT01064506.1~~GHVT01064506.1.p1  ORF type:complete len:348 (+),score=16.96 GHVT01064506.1:332-1375(+)